MWQSNRSRRFLFASALFAAVAASPAAQAATFVVDNVNNPGVGFNDNTAATPVGGNSGTTVGQQRLIAFQAAANVWAGLLSSSVTIRVAGQFTSLSCTPTFGTLGSAGPAKIFRDFSGAPVASTWFSVAEGNALHGSDLDPGTDDINANFNSDLGTPGCLTSTSWYYGLDGNPGTGQIDFMSVLIHELGHGLGFLTFVDLVTGAKNSGFNDIFMLNLENHGASPPDYPSMTNAQRVAASTSTGNLHWTGANVRAASGVLTAGRVGDHVQMYSPNPQEPGSSVSHWAKEATPNQVMEPQYTGPLHSPVLELPLFKDIGWTVTAPASLASIVSAILPASRSVQVGVAATAFNTTINTSANVATGCGLSLGTSIPATFQYQTTNPTTNALTGTVNTPVSIPANGNQSYVFAITPTAVIAPTDVPIVASCSNSPNAPTVTGLTTLLLSASATPVPDVIALAATASNDGIVNIPGATGTGAFAVATVNVGISLVGTVTGDTGAASLPVNISICQTNPVNGQCLLPPSSAVAVVIAQNQTPTFSVFVQGSGNVPFDPANNRIFLRFKDATSVTRGSTSVAARTQ